MHIPVPKAVATLEERGLLKHHKHDHPDQTIEFVAALFGISLPNDLKDFYRSRIGSVSGFDAYSPKWNARVGWRDQGRELTRLQHAGSVPLLGDGCGNLWGLDLASGRAHPPVYFFNHERDFSKPEYTAGSSLGAFLLLVADEDRAIREDWPVGWQLATDPDIDKDPRAPPPWAEA